MQPSRAVTNAGGLPSRRLARPRLGDGGFTIVEVMMASVILVVGFIGMISAITIGSELLATARRQSIAARILDHETSKLRLNSWSTLSTLADSAAATYTSDLTSLNTAITNSGVTYNLERDVTDLNTDLREVTLIVTWTKQGSTADATAATGSWLQQISFSGSAPVARTYTRKSVSWFTKYGMNYAIQR